MFADSDLKVEDKHFNHVSPPVTMPKVRLETKPNRRYIHEHGETISVTMMLKEFQKEGLERWRQNEIDKRFGDVKAGLEFCRQYSAESMNVGSSLHEIIERYFKNDIRYFANFTFQGFAFDPWILFGRVKQFLNRVDDIRGVEIPVYSKILDLAGTIDCVGMYEGKLSIIDHKNSRKKKPRSMIDKYIIQETLYGMMWEEVTGERIEQIVTDIAVWENDQSRVYVEDIDNYRRYALNVYADMTGKRDHVENMIRNGVFGDPGRLTMPEPKPRKETKYDPLEIEAVNDGAFDII